MQESTPQQQLIRMLSGYWIGQALHVAAKLGLADLVKDGPRTADDLAATTGSHAKSLYRLLRALASVGVFAEDDRHRFGLTALAECLRSGVPGSQRSLAIMTGDEHYQAFGQLFHSIQTGHTAFEKIYGMPIFDYLQANPEPAKIFDQAMVGVHGAETGPMLEDYDFSGVRVLADLGGGNGSVLAAVLQKYPSMRGILYDLPSVAERACANIRAAGADQRCRTIGGSFFESVPAGADAYFLRHIIHDWDDEKATQILRNVHKAIGNDGKLLLVEHVIGPGNDPDPGKLLDLAMLVIPGGQERTEAEYRALYKSAGFDLTRIVPTRAGVCVIEGRKL